MASSPPEAPASGPIPIPLPLLLSFLNSASERSALGSPQHRQCYSAVGHGEGEITRRRSNHTHELTKAMTEADGQGKPVTSFSAKVSKTLENPEARVLEFV